jgi:hypothetical protein
VPEAFVPEAPLSMITVLEDPLAPDEVDVLVEPVLLIEPVEPVLLIEPVEPVLLVEAYEFSWVVEENWTASAQVVLLLDWETITTFACPEKLYVPSKFHLPPFCN